MRPCFLACRGAWQAQAPGRTEFRVGILASSETRRKTKLCCESFAWMPQDAVVGVTYRASESAWTMRWSPRGHQLLLYGFCGVNTDDSLRAYHPRQQWTVESPKIHFCGLASTVRCGAPPCYHYWCTALRRKCWKSVDLLHSVWLPSGCIRLRMLSKHRERATSRVEQHTCCVANCWRVIDAMRPPRTRMDTSACFMQWQMVRPARNCVRCR